MDVAVSPRGEPMRCLREDVASDLLVEVWVMSYRGLHEAHGHPVEPRGADGRGSEGQILKAGENAQCCLI